MSTITITLAWADTNGAHEREVRVSLGTTLSDLLGTGIEKLGVPSEVALGAAGVGVWGRVRHKTYVLRESDRVEFYAPLKADPKEQRRRRVV
jgi:uncharacterized protein